MTTAPKTLAEALLEFQRNAPHIALDATNPHFKNKYPSLAGIADKVRPVATEAGLVVQQFPTHVEGIAALRTRITHAPSGEFTEDTMLLFLSKLDPQGQGSALTYARRYALLAMLGLVGDEDDDGEATRKAGATNAKPRAASPPSPAPSSPGEEPIESAPPAEGGAFQAPDDVGALTQKELQRLSILWKEVGELGLANEEQLRRGMEDKYGVSSKVDLTSQAAKDFIRRLETLKRNGLKAKEEAA